MGVEDLTNVETDLVGEKEVFPPPHLPCHDFDGAEENQCPARPPNDHRAADVNSTNADPTRQPFEVASDDFCL